MSPVAFERRYAQHSHRVSTEIWPVHWKIRPVSVWRSGSGGGWSRWCRCCRPSWCAKRVRRDLATRGL